MKAFKIIASIIVVIVLLVGGGLVAIVFNLGSIVKNTVERKGPEITLTSVNLSDVDVKLFQGLVELRGFQVANPQGFTSDYAFNADLLRIKVDPSSLQSGIIVLDDITVSGVSIIAEQKGFNTNIQALHDAVKQFSEGLDSGSNEPTSADNQNVSDPRFIVKKLMLSNNDIRLITEAYGEFALEVPTLIRNNLDGGGKGLTSSELAVAILEPILDNAENAVKAKLKKVAKNKVEDKLKDSLEENLSGDSKDTIQKLKGLLGK